MAERRTKLKAAAEPDFLQFNDLACETVSGKVSRCVRRGDAKIKSFTHSSS